MRHPWSFSVEPEHIVTERARKKRRRRVPELVVISTDHGVFEAKGCTPELGALIVDSVNERDRNRAALLMVLNSELVTPADGSHDWTRCAEISCAEARRVLGIPPPELREQLAAISVETAPAE